MSMSDKQKLLNITELDDVSERFSLNSLRVLASRYLLRDGDNKIIETPTELFERVAIHITISDILHDKRLFNKEPDKLNGRVSALCMRPHKITVGRYELNRHHIKAFERLYEELDDNNQMKFDLHYTLKKVVSDDFEHYEKKIEEYMELMVTQKFLPNSPTLMNAGTRLGQLSACFVLDMPDDLNGIMETTKDAAMIFKSGGGVGINYSNLREDGAIVSSTSGVASGPVSFMEIINSVTNVIKQGGKRRGANMGILDGNHPDIEKFITNKKKAGVLENFNISVGLWEKPEDYKNIDMIAESAWASAEPGIIFFDNMNEYNPFAKARGGPITATNPCGEQGLYPNESCNLGSINLSKFVSDNGHFDLAEFKRVVKITTRFLDNVIDINKYPTEAIEKASKESRRIGLGVMGVADMLCKMKIAYDSSQGNEVMEKMAENLTLWSMMESVEIAKERGVFELFDKSDMRIGLLPVSGYYTAPAPLEMWDILAESMEEYGIRNVLNTTVAPTGSISMIAECSNGIEPNFALVFKKSVAVGDFYFTNELLKKELDKLGLLNDDNLGKIANNGGSLKGLDFIPHNLKTIFITAMDIDFKDHIRTQSVWQKWIGNSISKTINMPENATKQDVLDAYILAHELGCKGLTVYRDKSRENQVLHVKKEVK
jgi:ribonucleoside-diphosphate reductase alpha chain